MNIVRVKYKKSKTIDTVIAPEDRLLNKSDSEVVKEMSNDPEQDDCTSDIIYGFIDRINENYGRIYLLSWVLGEVEQ